MFGNPESAEYSTIGTLDIPANKLRFHRIQEENEKLKKLINVRVDAMAEQAETDYNELIKKRDKMLKDKDSIKKQIEKLDELKNKTLQTTFKQVNHSFSNIFQTLLPGSDASLEQIDPENIQEGLKIKVAFNNEWKEGLSELSGGQRSLLALSYVLALLKYKPAPLYILDEIDAALDLQHTQNIGKMIKMHFPQS